MQEQRIHFVERDQTITEQVEANQLAPYSLYILETQTQLDNIGLDIHDQYNEAELTSAISHRARNLAIVDMWQKILSRQLTTSEPAPTVINCLNLEHAHSLQQAFASQGIEVDIMSSQDSQAEEKKARFGNGMANILLLTETPSFPLPRARVLINAAPIRSREIARDRVLPVLATDNTDPDKYVRIVDVMDNGYDRYKMAVSFGEITYTTAAPRREIGQLAAHYAERDKTARIRGGRILTERDDVDAYALDLTVDPNKNEFYLPFSLGRLRNYAHSFPIQDLQTIIHHRQDDFGQYGLVAATYAANILNPDILDQLIPGDLARNIIADIIQLKCATDTFGPFGITGTTQTMLALTRGVPLPEMLVKSLKHLQSLSDRVTQASYTNEPTADTLYQFQSILHQIQQLDTSQFPVQHQSNRKMLAALKTYVHHHPFVDERVQRRALNLIRRNPDMVANFLDPQTPSAFYSNTPMYREHLFGSEQSLAYIIPVFERILTDQDFPSEPVNLMQYMTTAYPQILAIYRETRDFQQRVAAGDFINWDDPQGIDWETIDWKKIDNELYFAWTMLKEEHPRRGTRWEDLDYVRSLIKTYESDKYRLLYNLLIYLTKDSTGTQDLIQRTFNGSSIIDHPFYVEFTSTLT